MDIENQLCILKNKIELVEILQNDIIEQKVIINRLTSENNRITIELLEKELMIVKLKHELKKELSKTSITPISVENFVIPPISVTPPPSHIIVPIPQKPDNGLSERRRSLHQRKHSMK